MTIHWICENRLNLWKFAGFAVNDSNQTFWSPDLFRDPQIKSLKVSICDPRIDTNPRVQDSQIQIMQPYKLHFNLCSGEVWVFIWLKKIREPQAIMATFQFVTKSLNPKYSRNKQLCQLTFNPM